jgi:hypothetical protein
MKDLSTFIMADLATIINEARATPEQTEASVARVSFWHITPDQDSSGVVECFFDDEHDARLFVKAHFDWPMYPMMDLIGAAPINPKTFSFRTECRHDAYSIRQLLRERGHAFTFTEKPLLLLPSFGKSPRDVGESQVEIHVDMTLEQMRAYMYELDDSHIMVQTLRELPLSENPLSRDHLL